MFEELDLTTQIRGQIILHDAFVVDHIKWADVFKFLAVNQGRLSPRQRFISHNAMCLPKYCGIFTQNGLMLDTSGNTGNALDSKQWLAIMYSADPTDLLPSDHSS